MTTMKFRTIDTATPPPHILVVEDEPKLARLLVDYLRADGYGATAIDNGLTVVDWVRTERPALVLLDLMLPGKDGIAICRELRTFSDVPIVMITARVDEVDRLLGLDVGADDYICKPFSPREVMARIRAIFRRTGRREHNETTEGLVIDDARCQVCANGLCLDVTPVELRLIKTLASSPGKVFSRDQLLDQLYEDDRVVTDRTVDAHVKNLRRKLEQIFPDRAPIQSVYGVGYKLDHY